MYTQKSQFSVIEESQMKHTIFLHLEQVGSLVGVCVCREFVVSLTSFRV